MYSVIIKLCLAAIIGIIFGAWGYHCKQINIDDQRTTFRIVGVAVAWAITAFVASLMAMPLLIGIFVGLFVSIAIDYRKQWRDTYIHNIAAGFIAGGIVVCILIFGVWNYIPYTQERTLVEKISIVSLMDGVGEMGTGCNYYYADGEPGLKMGTKNCLHAQVFKDAKTAEIRTFQWYKVRDVSPWYWTLLFYGTDGREPAGDKEVEIYVPREGIKRSIFTA